MGTSVSPCLEGNRAKSKVVFSGPAYDGCCPKGGDGEDGGDFMSCCARGVRLCSCCSPRHPPH
jgi:hypothetical protein